MDNLKKLTHEHHKDAERQAFVKELLSGEISDERYATYLFNQHACYRVLESMGLLFGLFDTLPGITRSKKIWEDYLELWGERPDSPAALPATTKYLDHLRNIMTDKDALLAHIYVRHMGDLYGGQMIAKKVPGEGRYYKFEGDIEELKQEFRKLLHDDLADEAKVCFEFASELFKDMAELK